MERGLAQRPSVVKRLFMVCCLLALVLYKASAQELVHIPSSQMFKGEPITLNGWMFSLTHQPSNKELIANLNTGQAHPTPQNPPEVAPLLEAAPFRTSHPVVLMMHSCGGALDGRGRLSPRMVEYAQLFNDQGWSALILDSFTPRNTKQICTQPISQRTITPELRAQDVLDAHLWLTQQGGVEHARIAYVGWSHGGSTVLAATNKANSFVAYSSLKPSGAVVFYPGCAEDRRKGYQPNTSLLVQIGEWDDWTSPGPCKAMVAESSQPKPELISYAGAYHLFDSDLEVKIRYDVGNGKGVHYGGQPEANAASKKRLLDFLNSAFQKPNDSH